MKFLIQQSYTHVNTNPEEKIKLSGLRILKNSKGHWVVAFTSENHKYLAVKYNISGNAPGGEHCKYDDGSYAYAHGFSIETCDTSDDTGTQMPLDSCILWVIPETKKEQEELSGVAAILPTKWAYSCAIIPYSDIEI